MRFCCLVSLFILVLLPKPLEAAEISLTLSVSSQDDHVHVIVKNQGRDSALLRRISIELDGRTYSSVLERVLAPGASTSADFVVALPGREGSYPLLTRLAYLNEGRRLSVVDAGYFHYRRTEVLPLPCPLPNLALGVSRSVLLHLPAGYRYQVAAPEEIEVTQPAGARNRFTFENTVPQFRSNYAYFLFIQTPESFEVQAAKICSARLTTSRMPAPHSEIPDILVLFCGAAGLCCSAGIFRSGRRTPAAAACARWGFSVFVVSAAWFFFRRAYLISLVVQPQLYARSGEGAAVQRLREALQVFLDWLYFRGGDYTGFFRWVADPLYLYMILGNGFVLYFLIRPDPRTDKYWHLMRSLFSFPALRRVTGSADQRFYWSPESKAALLAILVKMFYLPLLWSWTIEEAGAVWMMGGRASWSFEAVNHYIVKVLILVDVSIFAVGYISELPQLKNGIRSVEPTLLGWVVCLMCYPPFNTFSFVLFDHPLNERWSPALGASRASATLAITLLWAIYVWATVALGTRSSNLTNRGIVDSGPYRYVRHPAYTAKVSSWILAAYFLGEKNFFLIISFIVVYGLRAWTEERHLSRDPDYLHYKKKVRWTIIPGVF